MKKKAISLLLVLVMLLGMSVSAYALEKPEFEEPEIQPLYTYAESCSAALTISGDTAYTSAKLTGKTTVTKIEITMTLQKKTLWWWSDSKTWNTTVSGSSATLSKTASIGGGTFRVKAVCKVYSGSASESITVYSAEKKN